MKSEKYGFHTQLSNLKEVSNGWLAAHYWTSKHYKGSKIALRFEEQDIAVDPNSHGLPAQYASSIALKYGGKLSSKQVEERIEWLQKDHVPNPNYIPSVILDPEWAQVLNGSYTLDEDQEIWPFS